MVLFLHKKGWGVNRWTNVIIIKILFLDFVVVRDGRDIYYPEDPAKTLHSLYRFNVLKLKEEKNVFDFTRSGYRQVSILKIYKIKSYQKCVWSYILSLSLSKAIVLSVALFR